MRKESAEDIKEKHKSLVAVFLKHQGIHVMTYDRLLDATKKPDATED